MNLNKAAQTLGRKGGQSKSTKKQEASRVNFAKAREAKAIKQATPAKIAETKGSDI